MPITNNYYLTFILVIAALALRIRATTLLVNWLRNSHRHGEASSPWQCPEIPADMTTCSTVIVPSKSHALQRRESIQEANVWIALLSSDCHPRLMKFICSVYNPICLQSHLVMPIQPCREFCNEVHSKCIARMYLFGFKWPEHMECSQFPKQKESMCITANLEFVTCAPCQTNVSSKDIAKHYCEADLAIKGQIGKVALFGNSSGLKVFVDRVTENLLPWKNEKLFHRTPETVPSPGFLDVNDERYAVPSNRYRRNFNSIRQNKQTNNLTQSNNIQFIEPIRNPNGLKHRNKQRVKRYRGTNNTNRHRRRRSFNKNDVSLSKILLLNCATCGLDLPVTNSLRTKKNRWLILGKIISRKSNDNTQSPSIMITTLLPWSKDSIIFRKTIRDIRSIPRDLFCDSNSKVQMSFGRNPLHSNLYKKIRLNDAQTLTRHQPTRFPNSINPLQRKRASEPSVWGADKVVLQHDRKWLLQRPGQANVISLLNQVPSWHAQNWKPKPDSFLQNDAGLSIETKNASFSKSSGKNLSNHNPAGVQKASRIQKQIREQTDISLRKRKMLNNKKHERFRNLPKEERRRRRMERRKRRKMINGRRTLSLQHNYPASSNRNRKAYSSASYNKQ